MRRILLTGGAGFIGSNLLHYLAGKYPSDQITVLDQLTYAGSIENMPSGVFHRNDPRVHLWYGNVCNASLVNSLVQNADVVIHLAAETHVTRSIFDSQIFFQTDVIGTQTVAEAVLKASGRVKRFIHVSSSEVYGTGQTTKMNEDHALNPMSPYASAKCGADRLVYSYWATYRIPSVIVRPFNNFGPRQHLEKVVPRFVTSAILAEPLTVHGTGAAARDFVFVDDTCRAIDMIMNAPDDLVVGEVFNVASSRARTIMSIAQDVARLMDYDAERIQCRGDRPGQVVHHEGDCEKIQRILGWQPKVGWEDGLRATIDWYRNSRSWWEKQLWMRSIPIINADGRTEYH